MCDCANRNRMVKISCLFMYLNSTHCRLCQNYIDSQTRSSTDDNNLKIWNGQHTLESVYLITHCVGRAGVQLSKHWLRKTRTDLFISSMRPFCLKEIVAALFLKEIVAAVLLLFIFLACSYFWGKLSWQLQTLLRLTYKFTT